MLPTPNDLSRALTALDAGDLPPIPGQRNHLRTGVLVPLRWTGDDIECLVTLRPARMRQHAGEVCFPGGRPDPGDVDLTATALREADEELGIRDARTLGALSSMPLYTSDYRLCPTVAAIGDAPLTPSPDEVARVFRLSIRDWLGRPFWDGIQFSWGERDLMSPIFPLEGCVMYGGTAHVFWELLTLLAPLMEAVVPPFRGGQFTWKELLGVG